MKYLALPLLALLSFFLVGCTPQQSAPTPDDTTNPPAQQHGESGKEPKQNDGEMQKPADAPKDSENGSGSEKSSFDSPFSGSVEVEVIVSRELVLDPWQFAGQENSEQQETCQTAVNQGESPQGCKTNTVLKIQSSDGSPLPKEIVHTTFSPVESGPEHITIGCLDGDNNRFAAPIWVDKTIEQEEIISPSDQSLLIAASANSTPLTIRLTKKAYDILGRGGTNCDIFFHQLEVIQK